MNEHEITLRGYRAGNKNGCDILRLGTNGSYGVERLHLVPDGDWEGLTITAVFHAPDGTAIQVLADGGTVDVPPEATAAAGRGKVIFIGSAQGQQRISCDLAYNVLGHAVAEGTEPAGPAPSWYEQAAAHFLPDGGKAGQVLAKASDADLDVEWADGGNGTADHAKLSNRDASDQHPISAITGLETALDGKQPTGDYLTADTLQAATDAALAQAKESGEFDGEQGPKGVTPDIQVGIVTTLEAGSAATASMTGTAENPMLNLGIPKGADGQPGADGKDGLDGSPGADGKSAYQYAQDGGYTGTEAEFAEKLAQEMPTTMPNPNALTFTGSVTGSYDGSAPLSVEIPSGGGGGAVSTLKKVWSFDITETIAELKQIINFAGPVRRIVIIGKALEGSTSSASRAGITFKQSGLEYAETLNINGVVGESGTPIYSSAVFDVFAGGYVCEFLTNRSSDFHTWNHLVTTHYYYVNPDMMAEWDAIWFNVWNVSSGSIEIWTDAEVLG